MARIFFSFMNCMRPETEPSVMPCYYESFVKGLSEAGNDLMVFHDSKYPFEDCPEIEKRLKAALDAFSPDVVFAFNNYGPDFSVMCDCPIFIIEVDSPLYYGHTDAIRMRPDRYRYFVVQEDNRKLLRARLGVPDQLISDLPFFSEVRAYSLEKNIDISFVGSRFCGREFVWHQFRRTHREDDDIGNFRRFLEDIRNNPFISVEQLATKYPSLRVDASLLEECLCSLSSEKRIGVLSNIADLGLELFGTDEWLEGGGECADLYLAYNQKKIYSLQQTQDLYNRSRICINVNHLQAIDAFSWRVCDVMASSACLVTEYKKGLKKLFPDVPLPMFENKFEAREQCKRILANDHLREEITALSQAAVDKRFRFRHVLNILEAAGGIVLRQPGKRGRVEYCAELFTAQSVRKKSHRASLALQCLKLAFAQVPGCATLFNQKKCIKRIRNYADA